MISKLSNMLDLTPEELSDVIEIIGTYTLAETAVDAIGSLDPTFLAALGSEGIEIAADTIMCASICNYFSARYAEENSPRFFGLINNLSSLQSGLLAYTVTSILKFVVGKFLGKGVFYIGSIPISGGINAIQTIVTGLLWSKYIKARILAELGKRPLSSSTTKKTVFSKGQHSSVQA
jgi:hypothetical protein